MTKIIGGFVLGIATTLLVQVYLGLFANDTNPGPSLQITIDDDIEKPELDRLLVTDQTEKPSQPAPAIPANEETDTLALENANNLASLTEPNEEYFEAVPVSDDHWWLLGDGNDKAAKMPFRAYHQKLESERRDEAWSYYIEQQIKSFLGPKAATAGIDIFSVVCRTTICEIQSLGHDSDDVSWAWSTIMQDMKQQSWWSEFGINITASIPRDGKKVIITYINRKKPND